MRIKTFEYRNTVNALKNYINNYSYITSISDVFLKSSSNETGISSKYSISQPVLNEVLAREKMVKNEYFVTAVKEYNAVSRTLNLLDKIEGDIFSLIFLRKKSFYETAEAVGLSEDSVKKKKKKIIYIAYEELKKEGL